MKKALFSLITIGATSFLVSCGGGDTPKSDEAAAGQAKEKTSQQAETETKATILTVEVEKSKIGWLGGKKIGNDTHNGTVGIKDGQISVKDGKIIGGVFTIDMNNISNTDLTNEKKKATLLGHLKADDFFDVVKFPTVQFEILEVKEWDKNTKRGDLDPKFSVQDPTHAVTGNLSIKGVKKSITFPAKINLTEVSVNAVAKFNIKRFDWGVNYGKEESVENKIINNEINIDLSIAAKK